MTAPTTGTEPAARPTSPDPHLATGSYDPETYWSARAANGGPRDLETVCIFGAATTENLAAHRVQRRALRRALADLELDGAQVLEYGCGTGRWAPLVRSFGAVWHGVDISGRMCQHAIANVDGADVRKLQDGRIPHEDGTFDLVYSVTVLHHNRHDDQERILDEMLRVLRPGGTLVLYEDLGTETRFNMFPRTLDGWSLMLAARGFVMTEHEGVRYSILRSGLAALRRRLVRAPTPAAASAAPPGRRSPLHRLVDRLDCVLDPWLGAWLPERLHTSAVMTFERPGPRADR